MISLFRPDIIDLPTTNGDFATGDGIKIASAIGARVIDMQHIQVHPTAFIDLEHPYAQTKAVCSEIVRCIGGVLLTPLGSRFTNEVGSRQQVYEAQRSSGFCAFVIAVDALLFYEVSYGHAQSYESSGLMKRVHGQDLAQWMQTTRPQFVQTDDSEMIFPCMISDKIWLDESISISKTYLVGWVTPAIHYTIGGLDVTVDGQVKLDLDPNAESPICIPHLRAVGEVTGGLHGRSRLGGSSLLECVVFARLAAKSIEKTSR